MNASQQSRDLELSPSVIPLCPATEVWIIFSNWVLPSSSGGQPGAVLFWKPLGNSDQELIGRKTTSNTGVFIQYPSMQDASVQIF